MRRISFITAVAAAVFALLPLAAVAAPPAGGSQSAARPHLHWFAGSVSAVGTDSVSVGVLWTGPHDGQLNGTTVNLALGSKTRIVLGKDRTPGSLSSIQTGDLVGVFATANDSTLTTLTAARIHVRCNCHWIGGTIRTIGSSSLEVRVARTGPYDTVLNGKDVTLQVSSSTVYLRGKGRFAIGFSDLKVGDGVGIVFGANGFFKAPGFDPTTATFTAKRVHVWPKRSVPPASSDADAAAGTSP